MSSKPENHAEKERRTIAGISFMLLNALAISVIYAASKELTREISSNLVVFLYKFSILICILPWCFKDGISSMKTNRILLHASRGFLSVCGSLSLYYAIKHIELVDITAIGYIEQVVLVIIGVLYFKEQATLAKILGILLSFAGAILVVNPSIIDFSSTAPTKMFANINPYYMFVFMSIGFWASNCTVIKILGKTEKTKVQLFYVLLFSCIIAFPLAFMKWQTVANIGVVQIRYPYEMFSLDGLGLNLSHIKYLALLAVCYFTHSIAFFKALKYADLSTVIPFDYSRLVFAGILGLLLFGETPELGSYIGYALIVSSGIYLIRSEAKRRKKIKEFEIKKLESEYEHS
jgi:drug/metabolite transporter (DMT)-like permease